MFMEVDGPGDLDSDKPFLSQRGLRPVRFFRQYILLHRHSIP